MISVLAITGCTRASKEKPEQTPKQTKPDATAPVLSAALSTDITTFAPTKIDHSGVMIRFDRIRTTPLGAATEKLLKVLPDHRRVVGNTANRTIDAFDMVLITSSNPSWVHATNMAARMAVPAKRMRTILDNNLSPTVWSPVRGGAMGKYKPMKWEGNDPRVYFIPLRKWIVLTRPTALGTLLDKRAGSLERYAGPKQLSPWLSKLPRLMRLGPRRRLISLATLNTLPVAMNLPMLGSVAMPKRASAALERGKAGDVFSGEMHFDSTTAAAKLLKLLRNAQGILAHYKPQPGDPAIPFVKAIKNLRLEHKAKLIRWSLSTSATETVKLVNYAAGVVFNLMTPKAPTTGAVQPAP